MKKLKNIEEEIKEFYFKEIDSTQNYAKELHAKGIENYVVFSDLQTNGRGRHGREWRAPIGGLWFSFDMPCSVNSLFTIAIGVAIREVLEEVYNVDVKLKWPNDLILNNKKVGGILCERFNSKIIVGIGINTNVNIIDEPKATTFINEIRKTIDNYEIMKKIITKCKEIVKFRMNEAVACFRKNMAYLGEECFISAIKSKAIIMDITDSGELIIKLDGNIKKISAGEINVCI